MSLKVAYRSAAHVYKFHAPAVHRAPLSHFNKSLANQNARTMFFPLVRKLSGQSNGTDDKFTSKNIFRRAVRFLFHEATARKSLYL